MRLDSEVRRTIGIACSHLAINSEVSHHAWTGEYIQAYMFVYLYIYTFVELLSVFTLTIFDPTLHDILEPLLHLAPAFTHLFPDATDPTEVYHTII